MKTRIHALAGGIGCLVILTFWTSTVISELFTSYETVAAVKQWILYGMIILIPALAIAGGSGMAMGRCGASKIKPYCDGTHHESGWKD
tara:strand:+ start:2356 stop:2619 length:264 start_codon:yes stop_codon:yes gene_type:complete